MKNLSISLLLLSISLGCTEDEPVNSLEVNQNEFVFDSEGGTDTLTLETDASEWHIQNPADWVMVSPAQGTGPSAIITLTVDTKKTEARSETLILLAGDAMPVKIVVKQSAAIYPTYNISPLPPDESGMGSTAMELAEKMTLGLNIGNTLEAIGGETAWGNPKITKSLIDAVKSQGFDAIRLPCAFDQYADATTAEISADWLARVKEVVQYCVDNDMYTVLNIHWDGGWLENNVTTSQQKEVNVRQRAFWEQIATHLRDFDEHLLFASANEPNVEDASQMAVLDSYHQTFVDAVRSTGGRNSYRTLVIQGASTDIEKTQTLFNGFPADEVPGKLMAELHYYTPYQFCLMPEDASWGKVFYYWGKNYHSTIDPDRNATWGEEDDLNSLFQITHSQFVAKGYPVILGEFGAYKRADIPDQALHNASVEYFNKYVVQACLENGFIPFYWDTGGMIDRHTGAVLDQGVLNALLEGAGK